MLAFRTMTVAYDEEGRPLSLIDIRPMDLADILDGTIRIYRRNPWTFITILAVVVSIPIFVTEFASSYIEPALREMMELSGRGLGLEALDPLRSKQVMTSVIVAAAMTPISFFLVPLATAAIVHSVSETLLGHEVSFVSSLRAVLPKLGRIIGAYLLYALVLSVFFLPFLLFVTISPDHPEILFIALGFLLTAVVCFIFLIFFLVKFLFVTHAVVLENLGAAGALKRSFTLVSGYWWRTFGVFLIVSIMVGIVVGLLGLAVQLVDVVLINPSSTGEVFAITIKSILATVINVVINPFYYIAMVLVYYDLRIRKEGFDLVLLANSIRGGEGGSDDGGDVVPIG